LGLFDVDLLSDHRHSDVYSTIYIMSVKRL
jgi:hypothetical protein